MLLKSHPASDQTSTSSPAPPRESSTGPLVISEPAQVHQGKVHQASRSTSEQAAVGLSFETLARDPDKLVRHRLGSYVLRHAIGRVGSGIVYRAFNRMLGQECCVKIFYPLRADVANVARVIERGVRGVAALNHPNIVKVFDFGTLELADGSSLYLVMEFVHGTTLSDFFILR